MRAALYVRVSTDKQEVENQLLQLRPYCQRQGWELVHEYVDVMSGKEESRPQYDLMFKDAHKRLFDVLVFWDLSRFSRAGTHHTIMKLKELEKLGIDWCSYQEQYITTLGPWKDVVIAIFSTLAGLEREKISDRTKAGLERAKKNGVRLGRKSREYDFDRIWSEFERQGSINRTAKVLPYGYGRVHFIISHGIRTQEEYDRLIQKGGVGSEGENPEGGRLSN